MHNCVCVCSFVCARVCRKWEWPLGSYSRPVTPAECDRRNPLQDRVSAYLAAPGPATLAHLEEARSDEAFGAYMEELLELSGVSESVQMTPDVVVYNPSNFATGAVGEFTSSSSGGSKL